MKKSWVKLIIGFVLFGLVALFFINYYLLNQEYPKSIVEHYQKNSIVNFLEYDIQITDYTIMDVDEFFENLGLDDNQNEMKQLLNSYHDFQTYVLGAECEVTYRGEDIGAIKNILEYFYLQSEGFANGIELDLFKIANDQSTYRNEIEPGETRHICIPFSMISEQFKKKSWETIRNRKFDFVIGIYPVKKVIHL